MDGWERKMDERKLGKWERKKEDLRNEKEGL